MCVCQSVSEAARSKKGTRDEGALSDSSNNRSSGSSSSNNIVYCILYGGSP